MKEVLRRFAVAGLGTMLLGGMAFAGVSNSHTGYESDNDASYEQEHEVEVENENEADIWNMVKGMASTGYNDAKYNTGHGDVNTGDAMGSVAITSSANKNSTEVADCCGLSGSVSVQNSNTGAKSENDAWVKVESEVKIENENEAELHNQVCLTANTGSNDANYNTGNGNVDSGDAELDIEISNSLNGNTTVVE